MSFHTRLEAHSITRLAIASVMLSLGVGVYMLRGMEFAKDVRVITDSAPSFFHATCFMILFSLHEKRTRRYLQSFIIIFGIMVVLEFFQRIDQSIYAGTFDLFDVFATLIGAALGVGILFFTESDARGRYA